MRAGTGTGSRNQIHISNHSKYRLPEKRELLTHGASLARLLPFWERAIVACVRVFNRSTVKAFADAHAEVREPLFAWFGEVVAAVWTKPADIKARFPTASLLGRDRVVFNIKGNKYRVIVAIKYEFFAVYIRFIGTHAAYDAIDAATI